MRRGLFGLLVGTLALAHPVPAAPLHAAPARHIVLVTIDGTRTEEIFGGLDASALASVTEHGDIKDTRPYKLYGADTPEARRARLMPFLWNTLVATQGSIAGDRARGSKFGVANMQRFSYPGYAELLTGAPHDDTITSNDNRRYPYLTVLEFLRASMGLPVEKVAVFGSWETFNYISSHEEGAVTVNAGYSAYASDDPAIQALSREQFDATLATDSARHDAFTYRFAFDYLKRVRPAVLYIAFDETDDWAHEHQYARVLDALHRTDGYLKELWTWLQADPEYRDNTVLLVTVDHGRGHTPTDWSDHGEKVVRANETWMLAVGPDWPRRGEWVNAPDGLTSQIAATLAKAVGQDFRSAVPDAGAPLDYLWQH